MAYGMTRAQKQALDKIVAHVALNGAVPSVTTLAEAMQCNVSHASRQVRSLIERGQLSRMPDGSLALGAGGTFVNVPREIASQLADFCIARGERLSDTLRDAILLHMDQATAAEE